MFNVGVNVSACHQIDKFFFGVGRLACGLSRDAAMKQRVWRLSRVSGLLMKRKMAGSVQCAKPASRIKPATMMLERLTARKVLSMFHASVPADQTAGAQRHHGSKVPRRLFARPSQFALDQGREYARRRPRNGTEFV
jgi:hypothetical protein